MKNLSKRLLASALSLLVAGSCALTASATDGKYGDVNSDTLIDSSDALCILMHSVGKKHLSDDALVWANVNGDERVDSSDALEILLFSVGKIDKFSVETSVKAPETKDEMLAVYANALKTAREAKPSYKLKIITETKNPSSSVKKLNFLLPDLPQETLDEMESSMLSKDVYQNVASKGSDKSLNGLPAECTVTDASAFSSVACEVLDSGDYKIDIKFKDEVNPDKNSLAVKLLGIPTFDELKAGVEESNNAEIPGSENVSVGEFAEYSLNKIKVTNCWISCVVDAQTGEFVSLEWNADIVMDTVVVMLYSYEISLNMTMATNSSYTNFAY